MEKFPFKAALSQAYEIYGLELDEDTFETMAMSAWKKIGNKDCIPHVVKLLPKQDLVNGGWYICKPSDAVDIEAITLNCEDAEVLNSTANYAGMHNLPIENWIEHTKRNSGDLYLSGKLVKYTEIGDRVYFNEPFKEVNLLYKGMYTDEDGLPFLNQKEVDAIAAYCVYAYDMKLARLTKDANTLKLAQTEFQRWRQLCDAARVPESISQNSMNNIMDAAVSRDVHNYGRTFKPIR